MGVLAGWVLCWVCCVSCPRLGSSLFKIGREGACVELKTQCSFSDASPLPSHHSGSALVDVHVLLRALPSHKWSGFVCVSGAVGKIAGPCNGHCGLLACGFSECVDKPCALRAMVMHMAGHGQSQVRWVGGWVGGSLTPCIHIRSLSPTSVGSQT